MAEITRLFQQFEMTFFCKVIFCLHFFRVCLLVELEQKCKGMFGINRVLRYTNASSGILSGYFTYPTVGYLVPCTL